MKNLFMKNLHKGGSVACLCCAVLFPAASLSAQTAAKLERLLDTREITCAGAAYFTLGAVMDDLDPPAAFALALKQGWLPGGAGPGASVTLRDLSLLMMKAFNLEGGLMYRIFPGPRYAYREMTRQGFIQGRAYPFLTVSGERFLHILGNVLSHAGDAEGPEARRPLPSEAARDSLREDTGGHRGMSAGPEGVQGYEGEFEPE
ncbi:MAG: hypothetical protein LBK08_06395 [Treponema sp.]|nr:hypothetical protein [Treponema sp.]